MLAVQPRRLLGRPRSILVLALIASTFYWLTQHSSATSYQAVGSYGANVQQQPQPVPVAAEQRPLNGDSSNGDSDSGSGSGSKQTDSSGSTESSSDSEEEKLTPEEKKKEEEERFEDGMRKKFKQEYNELAK
jgi:hypothetical protein